MDKLDKGIQRQIMKWIEKHLHNIDFPTSPGKVLTGEFCGYVHFRVANYRTISEIDNSKLILTNLHVGYKSEIYKQKKIIL